MVTATERFRVVYGNDAEHEMDADEYAAALQGVSALVLAANGYCNGRQSSLRVRVRATERGSIDIDFHLLQSFADGVVSLLTSRSAEALERVVTLLGVGVVPGAITLWAWSRGKRGVRVEESAAGNGTTEVVVAVGADGQIDRCTVTRGTLQFIRSADSAKALDQVMAPVASATVSQVRFRHGADESPVVTTDIARLPAAIYVDAELVETKRVADADIQVRTVNFPLMRNQKFPASMTWEVYLQGVLVSVSIEDADFIRDVCTRQRGVYYLDSMAVEMETTQTLNSDGIWVPTRRRVLRVLSHDPAQRQADIAFGPDAVHEVQVATSTRPADPSPD